jgi:hypothetical protein
MQGLLKVALAASIMAVPMVSAKAQTYVAPPEPGWVTGPRLEGRSVYRRGTPTDFARKPLRSRSGQTNGATPYFPDSISNPGE